MLEGVARRRQFSNDRFVSGVLEPRLGDGQHIPFVFDNVLVYCERLISDRSCIDLCHVGGTLRRQRFAVPFGFENVSVSVVKCSRC